MRHPDAGTALMYDWLGQAVSERATVLTSSRRLARELRTAYDTARVAEGSLSWPTPDILFWQDWLSELLDLGAVPGAPVLVPASAGVLLWEQSLKRTAPPDVLSSAAVVRHARLAWQRLLAWRVSLPELARSAGNNDERWFARAAGAYEKQLRDGGWADPAELPALIAAYGSDGRVSFPAHIVHAGFDRMPPALENVLRVAGSAGSAVSAATPPAATPLPRIASYPDAAAEWRAAGAFARRVLQASPHARVAIIVPDLEADAATVARLVREGFAPGWQLAGPRHRASVDVSYGRKLGAFPLVAVALLCLQWCHRGLAASDVSILLRSPFLGDDDLSGRCRLERYLRTLPDREWRLREFLAVCREAAHGKDAVGWLQRMSAVAALQADNRTAAPPAEWARRVDELLSVAGWPGVTEPDSDEFQLLNRWRKLLNELAALAVVRRTMRFPEAVRRLAQLAADTVYQPESQPGSVHLLGLLEAAGMEFDELWIGGLDATRWPPAGHPLPLVSRRLQREAGMPDATPGETLDFAQHAFGRRLASARNVILSWPRTDREADLAPSPLIPADATMVSTADDDPGWYAASLADRAMLDDIRDDAGPPVQADEDIAGGAYTVQRQSDDPFTAFATARLGAAELPELQSGLPARHRGILLHRALQLLFTAKLSRRALAGWSEEERDRRIARAVDNALRDLRRHADSILRRLLEFERLRMQTLLRNLVEKECGRDEFSIVAVEERSEFRHGPVQLKLRIDRIDRLADGALLILDYKSGRPRPLLRQGGELADVQLGVYARAQSEAVGGLVLVNVDSREIRYTGAGGSVPWGRMSGDDWPTVLGGWLRRVDELLDDFARGDLRVNVLSRIEQTRPLSVLSRVAELKRGD